MLLAAFIVKIVSVGMIDPTQLVKNQKLCRQLPLYLITWSQTGGALVASGTDDDNDASLPRLPAMPLLSLPKRASPRKKRKHDQKKLSYAEYVGRRRSLPRLAPIPPLSDSDE